MKKVLSDKSGAGYINAVVKIIIAVIVGAAILTGIYLLFNNGILLKTNNQIKAMMYTGTDIQLRKGTKTVEYSYDGETWKACTVTGMDSSATVSSLVTMGEGESTVWVMVYKSSSGARACSSTNGIDWIPIYYDASNITLSKGSTYLYLNCNDGRQYRTTDGITWQMTSTKRY